MLEGNIYELNMFIRMYLIIEFCLNVSFCSAIFLNLRLIVSCHAAVMTLPQRHHI